MNGEANKQQTIDKKANSVHEDKTFSCLRLIHRVYM